MYIDNIYGRCLVIAGYCAFVGFVFFWMLGGFNFTKFSKKSKQWLSRLPALIMRDPNDWRTPARGGWRTIQVGDVCEDEDGNLYTVRYSDLIGPKQSTNDNVDLQSPCFGCLSVDHREGAITAHYQNGRDDQYSNRKRDLVRIVSR